jgi:hypothetical protein
MDLEDKLKSHVTAVRGLLFILLAVMLLPLVAQSARADTIAMFTCGVPNPCGGGPITGPPYSATGANSITNLLTNVPGVLGAFTFSFDMGLGTAKLMDLSDVLTGTIKGSPTTTPFGTTTGISFGVLWDLTSAPHVNNFFASIPNFGKGVSQISFETKGGQVDSASVTISPSPVPEPGTLALFGSGILLCGRFLKRKKKENS